MLAFNARELVTGKINSLVLIACLFLPLKFSPANAQEQYHSVSTQNQPSKTINFTESEKRWLKDHPSITIAFDAHYAPYSFKNQQDKFVGIAVDIARKIEDKSGIQFDIYPNGQWKNLYASAQAGKVDVIATLVNQPGRENWFEFTRPYLSLSQYIITREEDLTYDHPTDLLQNKTVALIDGYSTAELMLQEIPSVTPYYVENLSEALQAVSSGIAHATVGDIGMSNHLITKLGLSNLRFSTLYTSIEAKQRFGIRKDWPELATIIDKSLGAISYQELMGIYSHWRIPEIVKPKSGFISVLGELTPKEKQWLKEHPVIRLASDSSWLPFENIDHNNQYTGIAADYMKLIEQRLGIKFIRSPRVPWDSIIKKFKAQKLDVFSSVVATDEKKEFALFTEPYISYPMVIVSQNNIGYIDGLKGLHGKTIAIENNYATYDILKQHHPEILLQAYSNSVEALRAVSKGNAYAYVGNIASSSYILRDHGFINLKISGQLPYQYSLAMGVRTDWETFIPILQKALDSISLEEKNRIISNWIGIEIESPVDYKIIWQIIAIAVFIFIFFIYWNYLLKKKIKKRTSELHYQANYDNLTNLPNRLMSFSRLTNLINEAQRNKKYVAILLLDLDDFKKINDVMGPDAGDRLLVITSQRLLGSLEDSDLLGRLGGDEFIIGIGNLASSQDAIRIVENILNCFNSPFNLDRRNLKLTVSIGISFTPNDGNNISELLRSADTAMYHAKNLGKNTYSIFDTSMKEKAARRLTLEECMDGALERGEFEVYYQPKLETDSRKIIGFEALLRWKSKDLGFISPTEFIYIAESNGLIAKIGKFVLEQALEQLAKWQSICNYPLQIAVNLSPSQFRDENLTDFISETLNKTSIPNHCLELEITEGVLMSGYANIEESLNKLKEIGVCIAMDDFGTGYSSLSYLRKYPFDVLKIDREFVSDIATNESDSKLAKATIAIAKSFDLKVVAEGVETEEQYKILYEYGCDYIQGFLFGKPQPAKIYTEILIQNNKTIPAASSN